VTAQETGVRLELDIERVGHGGICIAHAPDGRVVFVRHALPGERVIVAVTESKKSYLRGDAVEVLKASPDRVDPPCVFAGPGRCGGCDWQHVALPAQRVLKATVVREQLQRLAGLDLDVTVEELAGAPDGLGWRTRVRFAVDRNGVVGFHKHRSHGIEPVDSCAIAHPLVNELGVPLKTWQGAVDVSVAVGAITGDRVLDAIGDGKRRPHVPWLDAPTGVLVDGVKLGGRTNVREEAAGRSWRVSGTGFWQVHPAAADTLVEAVRDGIEPRPGERLVDLYAGAGLFAGALATGLSAVVAVESHHGAVSDARRNLADLPHVSFVHAAVEDAVGKLDPADLVVLDPPRSGAGAAVVAGIAALRPRRVAYVACDPAALARDIKTFSEHGYVVQSLRAFDLFPMTAHVECVAVLAPTSP
jgi:tRNA/tmRNA/rRNA uracil-C5-methylase (TrmA/RlmC/RlmD family)